MREQWQIDQGEACPCKGADDMCPCQNVERKRRSGKVNEMRLTPVQIIILSIADEGMDVRRCRPDRKGTRIIDYDEWHRPIVAGFEASFLTLVNLGLLIKVPRCADTFHITPAGSKALRARRIVPDAYDKQRDIEAEGQRAAIHHGKRDQ